MKTLRGLKQIATRAANRFQIGKDNSAYVIMDANGEITVYTRASNGDNVPWAKELLLHVARKFQDHGYVIWYCTMTHCCGNCSVHLTPKK